jgi:hypothetical protein
LQKPKWQPSTIDEVESRDVEALFEEYKNSAEELEV